MKKLYLLLLAIIGATTLAFAQDKIKVQGIVIDQNKKAIPGALILIRGTNFGATTDGNGQFIVNTKPGSVLLISCLGYTQQEIEVKTEAPLQIMLKQQFLKLQDVVVTGYGRQERRDILGSVSTVVPQETNGGKTIDQLLAGQASGVLMSNSSGALGAANMLIIRGISSVMGDNNPLWVIDGVPIYGTGRSDNSISTSGGSTPAYSFGGTNVSNSINNSAELKYGFEKNPLASLNPNDIESIEILKDAFATAIYGSRGTSGVILVTTKKGSRDRTKVDFNYSLTIENPLGKLDLLNGEEYNMIYSMYYPSSPFTSKYNTDWIDAVTRQAVSHNYSASVSGGTDKTTYFMSVSGTENQSYIINNDLTRFTGRVNLDSKLSKYTNIGTNITISQLDNSAISAPNIYSLAARKAPNLPIYGEDGKYFYGQGTNPYANAELYNPVATAEKNLENTKDYRVTGNIYLEVRPTDWLSLKTDFGIDSYNSKTRVKKADVPAYAGSNIIKNQSQESVNVRTKFEVSNTLNVTRMFGDHFIQGIIGQSYSSSNAYNNSIVGRNFFSVQQIGVGAAQERTVLAGEEIRSALLSFFARANYQFKGKYMFGAAYRIDGSSAYNKDNRYIGIPSVSVGWRLGNEKFIKDRFNDIEELKIRASVGWSSKDGNATYYGAQSVYRLGTTNYMGTQFLNMSQPGNSNLRWEKAITYDVGLDFSLFDNKLDLTLDYYYKNTTDMLFNAELPAYTGYLSQPQNIGDMTNSGIELRVNIYPIKRINFQWMTTLTMAHNSNKIKKLNYTGTQIDYLNNGYKYYEVGKPVAQFYLHKWHGIDPATGDPLWMYKDGTISKVAPASDNQQSNLNKFISGSGIPNFHGGFSNTFLYKGFELNFLITFSQGGKMINGTKAELLTYTTPSANNLDRDVLKFWQIQGHQTGMPRLKNASVTSTYDYTTSSTTTRFLEDNSFIRLKNLEIAYNVPVSALYKSKVLKQLRVFCTMSNLFTLTKYSGIDPEVSAYGSSATTAGYDNLTMPQTRAYQFGVRVGF